MKNIHNQRGGALLWLIIVVVVIAGAILIFNSGDSGAPQADDTLSSGITEDALDIPQANEQTDSPTDVFSDTQALTPSDEGQNIVTYTESEFSPETLTVSLDSSTVTFLNNSSKKMWVASDNHPTHTVYAGTSLQQHCPSADGTAFDQCAAVEAGGSYVFTFTKVGSWKYHNHYSSRDGGTVIVNIE